MSLNTLNPRYQQIKAAAKERFPNDEWPAFGFSVGADWADQHPSTPEWRDLAKEKPTDRQHILALFKGGMMIPCYWREDGNKDAILHFTDGEVNLGPVKITHWLPIPPLPTSPNQPNSPD